MKRESLSKAQVLESKISDIKLQLTEKGVFRMSNRLKLILCNMPLTDSCLASIEAAIRHDLSVTLTALDREFNSL